MRWAALAAAVFVVAGVAWHQYREDEHERALAAVASEIAARPVSVRCQGFFQQLLDVGWTAGEVHFDAAGRPVDETRLDRDVCANLERYPEERTKSSFACVHVARPCDRSTSMVAYSLHLLAHESWHLRGVTDEAQTECYALQTTALVAQRFGASPEHAQMLALWNLKEAYPQLPQRYRTGACVDGGQLDLRPADAVWP
jgi:hypothetical protein